MDERFALSVEAPAVQAAFQVERLACAYAPQSRYAPTAPVPVVFTSPLGRTLDEFRWGLFPFWAKDSILADGQEVYYKRAFDRILRKQRCVIPCSGFYGRKAGRDRRDPPVPFRIGLRGRNVFGLAGLYDEWITPRGERIRSCTILTTPANRPAAAYMTRMPLILEDDMIDTWLDARMQDKLRLKAMLLPIGEGKLEIESAEDSPAADAGKGRRAASRWLTAMIRR
jgi:putative SOS response-associated peptidase YedK